MGKGESDEKPKRPVASVVVSTNKGRENTSNNRNLKGAIRSKDRSVSTSGSTSKSSVRNSKDRSVSNERAKHASTSKSSQKRTHHSISRSPTPAGSRKVSKSRGKSRGRDETSTLSATGRRSKSPSNRGSPLRQRSRSSSPENSKMIAILMAKISQLEQNQSFFASGPGQCSRRVCL